MGTKLVLILSLALASSVSLAEVYDNGRYTTDSISELDWLDMSETMGRSYKQVAEGAGGFLADGWRIATGAELDDLFLRIVQTLESGSYPSDTYGSTVDLIDCMGPTLSRNIEGHIPVLFSDSGFPIHRQMSAFFDDETGDKVGVAEVTATFADGNLSELVRWVTLDDFEYSHVTRMNFGVFLVRDSEPQKGRGKKKKMVPCGN